MKYRNNYVVIEKDDLEKIKLKTTKCIDIKEFVDTKELDPILIEKSYYVAPDTKGGNDDNELYEILRIPPIHVRVTLVPKTIMANELMMNRS